MYDATAEAYAGAVGTAIGPATEGPIDRALLAAFVELLDDRRGELVADVGCGPGRVAAYLAAHGMNVIGIDVSRQMLTVARRAYPGIAFEEGRLAALPLATRSLAGLVSWYSIIHTPPEDLGDVCAELARVVAPHGHLLVAFQAGNGEAVHRAGAYGTDVGLTSYRHAPDEVARGLTLSGFDVRSRTTREPELAHEAAPQAFIFARAAGPPGQPA